MRKLLIIFALMFVIGTSYAQEEPQSLSEKYTLKLQDIGALDKRGQSARFESNVDYSNEPYPEGGFYKSRSSSGTNNKCKRLKLVEGVPELLILLNSNDGYLLPPEPLQINPPRWAKCVRILSLAAIESYSPLVSTTTAGAQYTHPVSGLPMASNKVLQRGGFEQVADENMTSHILPLDSTGNIYFQQLSLRNPSSAPDTFTGLVIILTGWYY